MPRLKVTIGPHRFAMEIANVNDPSAPTEINTPLFVGRVLVRIKDFVGVAKEGKQPIRDSAYFEGRSRKFAILIEGRFKKEYTGEEIQFGSDFDHIFTSFPRAPFNTGMRIAQWVDPATKWQEAPPNGRPYIMSPYLACMNTIAAYPAPDAFDRALLLAHHPHQDLELEEGEIVPLAHSAANGERKEHQYWRFVGLKGTPAVDAFLAQNIHLLASPIAADTPLPTTPTLTRPPLLLRRLGTATNIHDVAQGGACSPVLPNHEDDINHHDSAFLLGAAIPLQVESPSISPPPSPVVNSDLKLKKPSRFSLATLKSALDRHQDGRLLSAGDLVTAAHLKRNSMPVLENELERQLGPWRFNEDNVEILEDTTFIYLDPKKPHSVAERRKYFCKEGGKHRKTFTYDPDVIYATSFFSNFCDFNTFDLKMGPLNLNIAHHFEDQPVRYSLRSTRLAPRPDGKEGPLEEECFLTIAFELVD